MCRHNNVDLKIYNAFNAFVVIVFNYNFQRRDEIIAIVDEKLFFVDVYEHDFRFKNVVI